MSEKSAVENKTHRNSSPNHFDLSSFLIKLGISLIVLSIAVFIVVFYPLVFSELRYTILKPNEDVKVVVETAGPENKKAEKYYVKAADPEFGIVIPKIGANATVIPNVSPYDSKIYQQALTKGVAHAEGTVFPGQIGNTFIFSHSSVNVYDANRYNSVFYLLRKLDTKDTFYLTYQGKVYKYKVFDKKIVEATKIDYLNPNTRKNQATLMTCWPPGTTLKRLVVLGELIEQD